MSDTQKPDRSVPPNLPALALTRAGGNAKPAHASVYLLADHLDVLLAACEDIVATRLTWNRALRANPQEIAEEKHNLRDAVEDIRKLENTVIMRALKSRERADEVANVDKRFRQLAKLYVAGTAILVDAVAECHDSTGVDFATADSIPAYLRSRGLVDPDAAAPTIGADIAVGESFLIAKRIAAGALMDLAATFLDALELHYDLFLDENEEPMTPQINRFEDVEEPEALADAPAGSEPDDIGAFIEDVRKEIAASEQPDGDPAVWSRLGTPASVGAAVGAVTTSPDDAETTTEAATDAADDETTLTDSVAAEANETGDNIELVANEDARTDEDEIATPQADAVDASNASDDESEVGNDRADQTALSIYPEDDEPTEIVGLTKPTHLDDAENDTATTELEAGEDVIADDDNPADTAAEADVGDDNTEVEAASEADIVPAEEATDTDTREASDADDDSDDEDAVHSEASDVTILTAANEDDAEENKDGEPHVAMDDASEADHSDEDNADEDDTGLVITAANDDETSGDPQSEATEAEAEAEARADDKIATDATPDDSGDDQKTTETAAADAASAEATSDTGADPSETESDKKSKSLIDRLSSIRSE